MSEPKFGDSNIRLSSTRSQHGTSRRQFLGLIGAGSAAAIGVSGTAEAQGTPVVSMANDYFDPVGLHVESGTTVRFEIDAGTHSATAYEDRIPTEAATFDSGTISSGGFEHAFDEPGTYDYYCRPHQSMGMVGRIVVGEPGGPAEASQIPDGEVPASESIVEQGSVPADDATGADTGGMMDPEMRGDGGPGMMDGGAPGWMMLVPIGFMTAVLGFVGGTAYWALRRGRSDQSQDESALAVLEAQYARGEIDEEEFERRRERLERDA